MLKIIFLFLLLLTSVNADNFTVISITNDEAFNYFASLNLWLLIISSPFYLLLSLIKYVRKIF